MKLGELARRWWPVPVVIALLAVAFGAGRFTVPERVDYRVVQVENETNRAMAAQLAELQRQLAAKTDRVITRWRVVRPDGSTAEGSREEEHHEVQVSEGAKVATLATSEQARVMSTEVQRTVTAARPDWRFSGYLGAQLGEFSLADPARALMGGLSVEKRLIWGISGGIFVMTSPREPLERAVVAVTASVEF